METRNNFDVPPVNPKRAWSDQQGQQLASKESWVHSTEDDSSFEITNEFGRGQASSASRPNTSPHSIELTEASSSSSQPTTPSGPVPTPRKRSPSYVRVKPSLSLETEHKQLTQHVRELQREREAMEQELELLKQKNEKTKPIIVMNMKLQRENAAHVERISELEAQLGQSSPAGQGSRRELAAGQSFPAGQGSKRELAAVRLELEQRQSEVTKLQSDKQELERKLDAKEMESLTSAMSSVSTGRLAVRLNDALTKIKTKDEEIERLKQVASRGRGDSDELERVRETLYRVTKERESLQQQCLAGGGDQERLESRVEELSAELSSTTAELSEVHLNYTSKCQELAQLRADKEAECLGLREQLQTEYEQSYSTSSEEASRTIEQLAAVNATLRKQLVNMTAERYELGRKCDDLNEDYKRSFDECNDLQRQVQLLKGEQQKQAATMEQVFQEIQQEAGDTLGNYNEIAEKLVKAERERDEYRMKNEHSLQVLAARNSELRAAENALVECERSWCTKLEENKRREQFEAEQARQVTETQMVVYREDFNEERKAREAMAGEKYQLEELLKTKVEEIRGLKRQLNEQAAMAMQTDFEPSHYPDSPPPLRAQDPGHALYQSRPQNASHAPYQPHPQNPPHGHNY